MNLKAVARETITVADTAKTLTTATYVTTTFQTLFARINVTTAQMRATFDGTAPVASTTGDLLNPSDTIEVWGTADLGNFKAIREGSTSAVLQVTYFGLPL